MIKDEIATILQHKFSPEFLEVHDDSEKHHGHAGYKDGGESHFRIVIGSTQLNQLPRLARHRAINDALGDIHTRIHALQIVFR